MKVSTHTHTHLASVAGQITVHSAMSPDFSATASTEYEHFDDSTAASPLDL